VDKVFVRIWILLQAPAGIASYRFVGLVNIENFLGFGIQHPEDFLNITGHLPEPLIAFRMFPARTEQEPGVKEDHDAQSRNTDS
jgi:hypothetical protein